MSSSAQKGRFKAVLTKYYPVGTIHNLTPMHYPSLRSPSSADAEPFWRVDSDAGTFCFKKHRQAKSAHRALFEELFQCKAYASGASVPELIKAEHGSTYVMYEHHRWWLERFIEGPHHSWWRAELDGVQCRAAGAALFGLHRITSDWVEGGTYRLTQAEIAAGGNEEEFVRANNPLVKKVLGNALNSIDNVRRALHRVRDVENSNLNLWVVNLDRCQRLLEASRTHIVSLSSGNDIGERVVVHGDFHPGNTIFSEERVGAIVDFEHVHVENRLYDVAYGMLMFGTRWEKSAGEYSSDNYLREQFLMGYVEAGDRAVNVQSAEFRGYRIISCILVASWLLELIDEFRIDDFTILNCMEHTLADWRTLITPSN